MGKGKKQKRDAAKAIELAAAEVNDYFHACANRKENCVSEAQSGVVTVNRDELTTRGLVANGEAADDRVASGRARGKVAW